MTPLEEQLREFSAHAGVRTVGVDPEFGARLLAALRDPYCGGLVTVSQLVRTWAEQNSFWVPWEEFMNMGLDPQRWNEAHPGVAVPNLAARPGTSNHERGLAADLRWTGAIQLPMLTMVLLKYGLWQSVRDPKTNRVLENWHFELHPTWRPALAAEPEPVTPTPPITEEEDDMKPLCRIYGTDPYDAQFIRFSNGEVRHLGPGEITLFDVGGEYQSVPKVTETDRVAYHRLVRASGTNWRPSDMPY